MARPKHPLVIAHRGASGHRPENTLAAFTLAVEQRADMIETDLHRSRDAAIVIRHDGELASLGGEGGIADSRLADIQRLDAGDGQMIPTLDEVLDRFGQTIPFNLEIKTGPDGAYPELEADALAAVECRDLLGSTLFSSFDDGVLQRLRALSPKARLAVLVSPRRPKRAIERAEAVGAEAINPALGIADSTPKTSPSTSIPSTNAQKCAGFSRRGSMACSPITPIIFVSCCRPLAHESQRAPPPQVEQVAPLLARTDRTLRLYGHAQSRAYLVL